MPRKLLLFLTLILSSITFAQSDFGNWIVYFGNKNLNRFNLHHEVQYRNYNAIGDLEQLLLRAGLGYNLTENNNNILLGYGYVLGENYAADGSKTSVQEHRIYEQFITKQKFGRFNLQHRYRFEQRFVDVNFRLRFRYFLSTNVPLNRPEMDKNTLYLSAYNELFMQPSGNYFDRNRLYGGLGFVFSPIVRLELGYMNQFLYAAQRDQLNLLLFVQF